MNCDHGKSRFNNNEIAQWVLTPRECGVSGDPLIATTPWKLHMFPILDQDEWNQQYDEGWLASQVQGWKGRKGELAWGLQGHQSSGKLGLLASTRLGR